MTDGEIEVLIRQVYDGLLTPENLPVNLYAEYVDQFARSIDGAFTGSLSVEEQALRAELYENIQFFSSSKTFQAIKDMESALVEVGMGRLMEYSDFREKALAIFNRYNTTWLSTELVFTGESARAGRRWLGIWADRVIFPLLEYVTVGDQRVRDTHKVLDGVIRPVEDAFWNTYYPPWSWRCRCTTKKLEEGDPTTIMNRVVFLPKIKRFFQNNVGKTGVIFNKFHPYFKQVPERYKELAKQNFGLPFIQVTKKTKLNE
jgi:SPP1 gp7 family putative phage head morphogenesis protein